jgi:3',5'-cyclic AMP phosphodiesterase CpdA
MTTIAQISDTHVAAGTPAATRRLDDLARTVAAVNRLRPRPLAVVHTGDVAHDATAEDYRAACAVLKRLELPLYAIVGNRDRRGPFKAAFAGAGYLDVASPFIQYAVDLGLVRLVAVDTLHDESGLGGFCARRAADLERLLAERPGQPTLVIAHHPPVEVPSLKARNPLQFHDAREAAAMVGVIGRAPHVAGVVAGHIHRTETVAVAHTTLTTMTSVAADLRRGRDKETDPEAPVIHLHTIADGRVTMRRVVIEHSDLTA